jgi:hypothetical protein
VLVALSLKYSLLVFGAVLGIIQAAAGYNHLRGLLFFKRGLYTSVFAAIAIGVPLGLFFTWNYMFTTGIIAGSQQAGLFVLSVLAAVVFTLIVSSLINIRYCPQCAARLSGLDALRERTFFRIIWERITVKNND